MDLTGVIYYLATMLAYFFIYNILTFGLNIQFGYTGIPNFTYITFMAAGAYFTGVTTLPHAGNVPGQNYYILGLSWTFPWTLIAGAVAAGVLGGLVGLVAIRRLRSDYLAIVTFSLGFIAYDVVATEVPLFNGFVGLIGVPAPLNDLLNLDINTYQFVFIGLAGVVMLICWFVAHEIYHSPLGRTLRATREDIDVAEALGKDTFAFRMKAFVIGCVFAGIAGGLTIEFVTALNPSGWTAPETFVIWAALLLGGKANNWGAILGALLVPLILFEGTRFIPVDVANPLLIEAGRLMLVGLILILVLWFRPEGLIPEPRKRFYDLPVATVAGAGD